jgi:cell division protein FtsL
MTLNNINEKITECTNRIEEYRKQIEDLSLQETIIEQDQFTGLIDNLDKTIDELEKLIVSIQ